MDENVKRILDRARQHAQEQIESISQAEKDWEGVTIPEIAIHVETRRLYSVWAEPGYNKNIIDVFAEDIVSKQRVRLDREMLKQYLPYTPKTRSLFPRKDD